MENEAVEGVDPEVLERARERLGDLLGDRRGRVVRKAIVLPFAMGELGLEEQILASDEALTQLVLNGLTDRLLEVVLPLIGGVDPPEPGVEGVVDQALRPVLFPGRSVEKVRDPDAPHVHRHAAHPTFE